MKKALLKRFMRLYNAKKAELALTDDGLHPRDCWTWVEVAAQNEQLGDLGTELPAPPPVERSPDLPEDDSTARGSADVRELPVHVDTGPEPEPAAPDNESASDTSSTSSGSASDVSNEATDLEGLCRLTWLCPRIGWCRAPRCTSFAARRMGGCSLGAEMPLFHRTLGPLERVSPPCPASVFASDAWLARPGGCTGHCRGTAGG